MRLMFVYKVARNTGSSQDLFNYSRVAAALGHEIVIYGQELPGSELVYSADLASADAIVFIMETYLKQNRHLSYRQMAEVFPRDRRVVIDCDGMYNDVIQVDGDYNHTDQAASRERIDLCDSLADKIFQPTHHPLRPNVRTFLFHAYSPDWEPAASCATKAYGMVYVGNNWFRWEAMRRVLDAIEPIRADVGRVAIAGYGWNAVAEWVQPALRESACYTDPTYLERLQVELTGPVPVSDVVPTMGKGVFNPVLVRPLFNALGLVTCRTFETPAADSIPLLDLADSHVKAVYGEPASELILNGDATEKIRDVLQNRDYYAEIIARIRQRLRIEHSYAGRLLELIKIVRS
jgi:hypothetical protein